MTKQKVYERLVSDLASMHVQALEQNEPEPQYLRIKLQERLEQAGKTNSKQSRERAQGVTFQSILGRPLSVLASSAAVLALAIFVGWSLVRRPMLKVEITAEPVSASVRNVPAPASSGSVSPVVADRCLNHIRANGSQPLIDDFEDGNPLIGSFENRVGLWGLYKDTDSPGANMPLTPTLRAQPTRGNRFALHAVGGELRNWGATVQFAFQPSCYDANIYGGIAFSAKGPGRVYAGVREVRVVPVEWGGTCTHDCYDTHQKKVDLGARWQMYSIKWSELHQRGYNAPPLDPTRIQSIGFLIQPGDTPFDIWFDDLKFISRK